VALPPLRERKEDIPALARHFAAKFAPMRGIAPDLTREAIDMLMSWQWPGNIRELENSIHRAIVMAEGNKIGTMELLALDTSPAPIVAMGGSEAMPAAHMPLVDGNGKPLTLEEIERAALRFSLMRHKNNVTQAAKSLGVAKSTFYRRMKELGLAVRQDG